MCVEAWGFSTVLLSVFQGHQRLVALLGKLTLCLVPSRLSSAGQVARLMEVEVRSWCLWAERVQVIHAAIVDNAIHFSCFVSFFSFSTYIQSAVRHANPENVLTHLNSLLSTFCSISNMNVLMRTVKESVVEWGR